MQEVSEIGLDQLVKMRNVIFEASVSLDGFIEGPDGELDWLLGNDDAVFGSHRFFEDFDTMFFGRKAYEKIAVPTVPPAVLNEENREFCYMLHGMRKYVFSRQTKHVRGNGMVVRGNLAEEVNRIRDENGKNILFCGGADIFRTFVELDLIDEYIILVHPVLLHSGKSLFGDSKMPLDLKLMRKQSLSSGIVVSHYMPVNRIKVERYES